MCYCASAIFFYTRIWQKLLHHPKVPSSGLRRSYLRRGSGGLLGYSCSYCSCENTTTTQKNAEAFSSGFREPSSDSTEQHFTAEHVFLFVFLGYGSGVYKNLQPQKNSCDTENEIITDGRFNNSLSLSGCFFFLVHCLMFVVQKKKKQLKNQTLMQISPFICQLPAGCEI